MLYLVKQSAWEAAGFDGNPKPQPVMEVIQSGPLAGCVMLAFPYYWWQPDDLVLVLRPMFPTDLNESDILAAAVLSAATSGRDGSRRLTTNANADEDG